MKVARLTEGSNPKRPRCEPAQSSASYPKRCMVESPTHSGVGMRRRRWLLSIAMSFVAISEAVAGPSEEIQLIYSDSNVYHQPFVDFRARNRRRRTRVCRRRELDNGLVQYNAITGFYPKGSPGKDGLTTISVKDVLYGPGEVTYTIPDFSAGQSFRAYISRSRSAKYGSF